MPEQQHSLVRLAGNGLAIELDGTKYDLRRWTLQDYADMQTFCMNENIKAAQVAAKAGKMPPHQERQLMADVASRGMSQADLAAELVSMRGMIFMLHRSFRGNEGCKTSADVVKLFGDDLDLMAEVVTMVMGSSTPGDDDGKSDPTEESSESPSGTG